MSKWRDTDNELMRDLRGKFYRLRSKRKEIEEMRPMNCPYSEEQLAALQQIDRELVKIEYQRLQKKGYK